MTKKNGLTNAKQYSNKMKTLGFKLVAVWHPDPASLIKYAQKKRQAHLRQLKTDIGK